MMGETVAHILTGEAVSYQPRLWFNSAKFFDIEYQVYGHIHSDLPAHHGTLYWEHEDGDRSVRINYERSTRRVVGFNLMGIRYRHEVCEKWILEQTPLREVVQNLGLANFDPELYAQYEQNIVDTYMRETGDELSLKHRRGLKGVLQFLSRIPRGQS